MINNSSQKIFNNSLLYALGTVLSKAVGFFLVPIYTYNLTNEAYGAATTITSFISTFGVVVILALRAAMIRFYNDYTEEKRRRFVGTIVTFVLLNAAVLCTVLCLLNRWYMPFLFKGMDFFPCVFWGVLSLGAEGVYLVYQSLLQAKQDGKGYSLNSIIYLFFHGLTVVVFVAFLKLEALGVVLASFVTNACFAIYGLWSMLRRRYMVLCIDGAELKKSLKYSLPILPHNLANDLNNYSVKLIIGQFLGYALSGLYTLASQFATIVNLVQSSVNLAFRPWFIEQMQSGNEGRGQIKHMSCMIMALFSFCAVGVALYSKEIVIIMAEKTFEDAWQMVPVFILVQLISFIYYSHVQTLMYNLRMSKFTAVCSFTGLGVNVGVSLLLVESLGVYGILIGQLASKIALSTLAVIMSNKAENVDFGLGRMIGYILVTAVLIGAGFLVSLRWEGLNLWGILLKLVILCGGFAAFLLPYGKDYRILLAGLFRKNHNEKGTVK